MLKNSLYLFTFCLIITSCGGSKHIGPINYAVDFNSPDIKQELLDQNTFKIDVFNQDKTYGYDKNNPVMVGGALKSEGPLNERRFLNALSGPNGEEVSYNRLGSCCDFATKNSPFGGGGKLDKYSVTYNGLKEPVVLFINMYDSDTLKVPDGFRLKYSAK